MGLGDAELPQAVPVQLGLPATAGASAFDAAPGTPIVYLYAGQEMDTAYRAGYGATPDLARSEVRIDGSAISVHVAGEDARFDLAPDAFAGLIGAGTDTSPDDAAGTFVHDLLLGGHVNFGGARGMFSELVSTDSRKHTHVLASDPEGGAPVLKRQHFDCGLCCFR
jgi:hypothetical protein